MERSEILNKLKEIYKKTINEDADLSKINEKSTIKEDLGLNSIGVLYLIVVLDDEFNILLINESFDSFVTVKDLIDYIKIHI